MSCAGRDRRRPSRSSSWAVASAGARLHVVELARIALAGRSARTRSKRVRFTRGTYSYSGTCVPVAAGSSRLPRLLTAASRPASWPVCPGPVPLDELHDRAVLQLHVRDRVRLRDRAEREQRDARAVRLVVGAHAGRRDVIEVAAALVPRDEHERVLRVRRALDRSRRSSLTNVDAVGDPHADAGVLASDSRAPRRTRPAAACCCRGRVLNLRVVAQVRRVVGEARVVVDREVADVVRRTDRGSRRSRSRPAPSGTGPASATSTIAW